MPEITTLVETLRTFVEGAVNEDKNIAWKRTVRKGRQNQEVADYLTSVRKLLKDARLELETGDGPGGYSVQVLRDENVPFAHGPTPRFVQLEAWCSLHGFQRCEYEGITPTDREVIVPGLRFLFIMVDGLVSGISPPPMHDESLRKALQAEREAYDRLIAEQEEQERRRKLAKAQRDVALRVALQEIDKRRRRHSR